MGVLFGRKVTNLQELTELTEKAKQDGLVGSNVEVTKEVTLTDSEFKQFTDAFLEDQPWIDPKANCIRVINSKTGEKIQVLPEGYQYARYTGIEELDD